MIEKVFTDAFGKLHNTPAHVFTTTKIGGHTFTSEIIFAAGSIYMKINGKWTLSDSIKDMEQLMEQNRHKADSKDTYRLLNDEAVNGEMAAVYSSHSETPKCKIDLQVWSPSQVKWTAAAPGNG